MSNFNKLITNKPVVLTEQEVENLSETLSAVRTAGGGGQTKTYIGDGTNISINQDTGVVRLTPAAEASLYRDIPSAISSFPDANQYAKKADYFNKNDINEMLLNKQDKLLFGYDEYNSISSINGSAIADTVGITGDYYSASNPSGFINSAQAEAQIIAKKYITSSVSELDNFYSKSQTSGANEIANAIKDFVTEDLLIATSGELETWVSTNYYDKTETSSKEALETAFESKQDNLTQEQLSAISSVSSFKGTILTGDSNIRATSAEDGNNIKWTLELTAKPVVTDTTLSGYDGIVATKDSTVSSQWNVGIAQAYREQIEAVSSKLTKSSADTLYAPISVTGDVDTLKSSSGNWNKVSEKLDTSAFSTVSGKFLTAHQSLDDYATKSDINGMATQTWVGEQGFYTKASGDNDYAPKSVTSTINTLTGASAGWNEVTAKLDKSIYSNASGNWEASYNVLTAYSAAGTWLTAHQSLTNYYTKGDTSSKDELSTEFAKYVTSSNVTAQGTDYVMTTTGWKVLTLPGGGMTQVIHDETLTGQGNADNSKLGVAWSSLSGNTIYSAIKANSASAAKRLQDSTTGPSIQVGDVTALQNWASSNSSTWNGVTAKLGTAQYAIDSATFVTSSSNTITGTKQYSLTTAGWAEITGGSVIGDYVPYSATVLPIGTNNTATNNSIAIGASNTANDLGFAVGQSNTALKRSIAFGVNNYANDISLAIGYQNSASGNNDNNQSAVNIAIGYANNAADHAAAFINVCTAVNYAFAAGHANSAVDNSVAFCRNTSAKFYSFGFGHLNHVENYSYAFGRDLHYEGQWANGSQYGAFVIGGWNATTSYATTADAPVFIIGNGENGRRSDGFIVYRDGDVSAAGTISAKGMFAVSTDATLFGQSRVVNIGDTTARGTNWLGVSQSNEGFLKYVNGGKVGDLNGTSIQINFAPDGANSYGNITVNSQDNMSKVVHVPTASYNNMTTFDPVDGPNYMLRKTASGFDIGAKVVNVTTMPQNTEANTYYFVYEV